MMPDIVRAFILVTGRAGWVDCDDDAFQVGRDIIGCAAGVLDRFEGPQRAVDFRLVDAIVEPPALPVGHRLQRLQELLGQERVIVLGVDERVLPLVGIEDRGLRQRIPALHEQHARIVARADRVEIIERFLPDLGVRLRQPGQYRQHGRIGDLRALVQIDGQKFLTKDLFDALFVVGAGNPDLRAAFDDLDITVLPVIAQCELREEHPLHFGQRIQPQRSSCGIGAQPQHRVPGFGGVDRPHHDRAHEQHRLARPCAAIEQCVALGGAQQTVIYVTLFGRQQTARTGILLRVCRVKRYAAGNALTVWRRSCSLRR
jgi:hypothetical protein